MNELNKMNANLQKLMQLNDQQNQQIQELKECNEDLEKENEELYNKMQDYDEIKTELGLFKDRELNGGNFVFKEINKSKLKIQFENLLLENKQLKEKIKELESKNKKYINL